MFRWWLPGGLVSTTEIRAEVSQMAKAGFGGAEIQDVHHSIDNGSILDPAGHGWGTAPWLDAVSAALDEASKHDFQIDIAIGPSWPAAIPSITPNSVGAAKELVHGRAVVHGETTYDDAIPAPFQAAESGVTTATLLALQAWRINSTSSPSAKTVLLDHDSLIDLTKNVKNGRITWTPPGNATWLLLSYRVRGSGQQPEAGPHTVPPAYVIDHFSKDGSNAITSYWDNHILSYKDLRSRFKSDGGNIFEDSLELDATTFWTPNLPAEFQSQMNYDITSILPAIVREDENQVFAFSNSEITRGALNDYWTVMGNLYISDHVDIVKQWAHGFGMGLRVQPYGLQTDSMAAAAAFDIGEGETLGFKNLDDFRSLAGGNNMALHERISCEAAAVNGGAYSETWNQVLKIVNPAMAAGVNMNVFHGFAYKDAPTSPWPGFAAFSPYHGSIGYSEAWGPRQPQWVHAKDISTYFGRVQMMMRKGVARHDVAFLRQKGYIASGFGASYFSQDGMRAGWSLNFLAPSLLDLPTATVSQKRLAPKGPNFELLTFEGDAFSNQETGLPLDTAEKLLQYAKQGLKIMAIGNWSAPLPYGLSEFSEAAQVANTVKQLLQQPSVVNAASRADMPNCVADLGISPAVQYDNSSLIYLHREDGLMDHYFFVGGATSKAVAATSEAAVVDITILRRSLDQGPVLLNLWTGEITPIALYRELPDNRIQLHMALQGGQSTMISMVPFASLLNHATSTTAQSVRYDGLKMKIRANKTGTYTTTLQNGRKVASKIGTVPASLNLTSWQLDVQDFVPGSTNSSTVIKKHSLKLSSLLPWSQITELQDVSGIGTYTTKFDLGKSWPSDTGAMISFTVSGGSFAITVNDKRITSSDQTAASHDIGRYLKSGQNTIEIEFASTLLNRLRTTDPAVYGIATRQAYGVVGAVVLSPYREAVIS
ncbi:secreted protein [Rhizodiscina lignyota]|uniref:Secreted protein n=1 Tax=Rhizodiscina lignyota TaxID=1504668 RepID=A0A9P4M3G9_9PEZI|nr:secreted protein [Rhizodiscina lignyota]